MNRRHFIGHSCALGATTTTVGSALLPLALSRRAAADSGSGYCALVCILLAGGNDSYNMLVPYDQDQYDEYLALRSDLALPRDTLLPLPGMTESGRQYALHPGMPAIRDMYNNGEIAMLAGAGTLLEPFDAAALNAGTAKLPLGLFSHSDQIAQWQTAVPDGRIGQGWGGRMADLMQGINLNNGLSMNISLSGTNTFQTGHTTSEYNIEASGDGATGLNSYGDPSEFGVFRTQMIDNLLSSTHDSRLRREYSRRMRSALDNHQVFSSALQNAAALTTPFSNNTFSQSLRQITRTISARDELGANRQTFFITVGGWDHHDDVLNNQAEMLPLISSGLGEFRNALNELGVFDDVTTFTISDFGRTLTSNGKGSDHGWGGHQIVMGGGVNGGKIYGEYPLLSPGNALDVGRGIYAPTTSVDQYFAELALWFGVSRADLDVVLPNVRRFYSPESSAAPLGFLLP